MDEFGPEPEDYVVQPCGPLGAKLGVSQIEGKFLGEFSEDWEVCEFIRDRMERQQFWPSVWYCSDHGNMSLYAIHE